MPNALDYAAGRARMYIKASQLKSSQMMDPSCNRKNAATHMNSTFHYYHKLINALKKAGDDATTPTARRLARDMYTDMQTVCGYYKIGVRPNTLYGVFDYLSDNNNIWDRNQMFEAGVPAPLAMAGGGYYLPTGIVNFETDMQTRGQKVASEIAKIFNQKPAKISNNYKPDFEKWKREKEWKDVAEWTDKVNKALGNLPQAWAVVTYSAGKANIPYLETTQRWLNLASYGHKMLTRYREWETTDFKNPDNQKVVIEVAAYFIKTTVPVFGAAYAEVIRGLPNAMKLMESQRKKMDDAIEAGAT